MDIQKAEIFRKLAAGETESVYVILETYCECGQEDCDCASESPMCYCPACGENKFKKLAGNEGFNALCDNCWKEYRSLYETK